VQGEAQPCRARRSRAGRGAAVQGEAQPYTARRSRTVQAMPLGRYYIYIHCLLLVYNTFRLV